MFMSKNSMIKKLVFCFFILIGFIMLEFNTVLAVFQDIHIESRYILDDKVSTNEDGEVFIDFGKITNDGSKQYISPKQYIQISYKAVDPYNHGWGIQFYTDNTNYKGPLPAGGLVTGDTCIPLLWRVYNAKQTGGVPIINDIDWGIIIDKRDTSWQNESPAISLIYSNHLAYYPPAGMADRSVPSSLTNTNIYLYFGSDLQNVISSISGIEYSTLLCFDIYYLVPVPTILSVSPNKGVLNKKVLVSITGANFITNSSTNRTQIWLEKDSVKVHMTNVTFIDENTLSCIFDLSLVTAGIWNVFALNPDKEYSSVSSIPFHVVDETPVITKIIPRHGNNNCSSKKVKIKGLNFREGMTVKLIKENENDVYPYSCIVVNQEKIICYFDLTQVKKPGYWDVVLMVPDDEDVIKKKGFCIKGYHMAGNHFFPVHNIFNPFKKEKMYFKWVMTISSPITIKIYNLKKRLVKTILNNAFYKPGHYQIDWNGKNNKGSKISSGIYFVRFSSDNFTEVKKIIIVK